MDSRLALQLSCGCYFSLLIIIVTTCKIAISLFPHLKLSTEKLANLEGVTCSLHSAGANSCLCMQVMYDLIQYCMV